MPKVASQMTIRPLPTDAPKTTVGQQLLRHRDEQRPGLHFEDRTWSWSDRVREAGRRATWLSSMRTDGPFHVGVLLENVPDMVFLLDAAGLAGAVIVGLNPTRRGTELARDIAHTDCQLLLTDSTLAVQLEDVELPFGLDRVFRVDSPSFRNAVSARAPYLEATADPADLFMLVFTSGTSGTPKAVKISHAKATTPGAVMTQTMGFTPDDVLYMAMPLYHSNALFVNWGLSLASGAAIAMRRRFSASQFLPDVRKYQATFFNYVGRPLSYILATPEQSDDSENSLRLVVGNEGSEEAIARFRERFNCVVVDGFSSTEGGVSVNRTPNTPPGSIGIPSPGVAVANSDTGKLCPPAKRDDLGRLLNAEEAIGEFVNQTGRRHFEGYYNNPQAEAERMRNGWYWSGDLGYLDEEGFAYFVGRTLDWLRVDGENFGAVPIERLISRFDDVSEVAVYAVPAAEAGDEVMATLVMKDGKTFDPELFGAFLAAQSDLGTKWAPRFVRITHALPLTATNKVQKRVLSRERWATEDPVFWRSGKSLDYRPFSDEDKASLERRFADQGRTRVLD